MNPPSDRAALAAVVCVTLGAAAILTGLPDPGPAALGWASGPTAGPWSLDHAVRGFWTHGFTSPDIAWPTGIKLGPLPLLEGWLLAPITLGLGPVAAWNLLWAVRVAAATLGAGLLLRAAGLHPLWALMVGLAPALHGHPSLAMPITGAVAWAPLALFCLHRLGHGRAWGLAALALLCTSPQTWLLTLALWTCLPRPPSLRLRDGWPMALALLPWLIPGGPQPPAGNPWMVPTLDRLSMEGGGLALPMALCVALFFTPIPTRMRGAAGAGALCGTLSLGPLLLTENGPVDWLGRSIPLPGVLLQAAPPGNLVADTSGLGLGTWLGLALALGLAQQKWGARSLVPAGILGLGLLLAQGPRWHSVPAVPTAPGPGAVLYIEPAFGQWSLVHQLDHRQPISAGLRTIGPVSRVLDDADRDPAALHRWAKEAGFVWLVAPDGGVQAIEDGTWPDGVGAGAAPSIEAPSGPAPSAPADWTGIDPVLAPLLDTQAGTAPGIWARLYTHTADQGWTPADAPIVRGLTTLALSTWTPAEGPPLLLLSGLLDLPAGTIPAEARHPSTIVVLATQDLQTWGIRRYQLNVRAAVIDPELRIDARGLELRAWTVDQLGVDPALLPGDHTLFSARLDPTGRFGPPEPLITQPGLADPSSSGDLLAATRLDLGPPIRSEVVVYDCAERPCTELATIPETSVPHLWREGGRLRMLLHAPTTGVGHQVAEVHSTDEGRTWSAPAPTPGLPERTGCESPVATRFAGQPIVVCSERH